MLKNEVVDPRKLAYDRPSPKLKGFLAKYYGLKNHVPQNNNFVVFDDYYQEGGAAGSTDKGILSNPNTSPYDNSGFGF